MIGWDALSSVWKAYEFIKGHLFVIMLIPPTKAFNIYFTLNWLKWRNVDKWNKIQTSQEIWGFL